jgi:FlaG/FlaF family flagellin (archaellin)
MKQFGEHAVSPVVGVMLMLVVTIIIAAVVSGFAGGLMNSQIKPPTAVITGTFSVTSGMTITNTGGDPLPTSSLLIETRNGPSFGPNLGTSTISVVDLSNVTNAAGTPVAFRNPVTDSIDGYNITSFNPGDTWYVNITNCNPATFENTSYPYPSKGNYSLVNGEWTFSGDPNFILWQIMFVNPANIGKSFYLDVIDSSSGTRISESVVTITG